MANQFEQQIGYVFNDAALLATALTHTSYANEARNGVENNERLEFLGDSVLSFVVSGELFRHGKLPEGELTRSRAALVREEALASFAKSINLGRELRLGKGEEASGGRERNSILADAFEAVIAAIYLDGGVEAAQRFILRFISSAELKTGTDYKTQLQEFIQQQPGAFVEYVVVAESGPDHQKRFTVDARVKGETIGNGSGSSKKQAEQAAARQALERQTP